MLYTRRYDEDTVTKFNIKLYSPQIIIINYSLIIVNFYKVHLVWSNKIIIVLNID